MERILKDKKIITIAVLTLILVLFVFLYMHKSGQYRAAVDKYENVIKKCYLMEGSNGAWKLEGCRLLISENNRYLDGGRVIYQGMAKSELTRVDNYDLKLCANIGGKDYTLSNFAHDSSMPGTFNLTTEEGIAMGNLSGPVEEQIGRLTKSYQIPVNFYLDVKYGVDGQSYTSRINLSYDEINLVREISE